jgi:outer membrane protein OmpA-like peptidoglycan-associated protein
VTKDILFKAGKALAAGGMLLSALALTAGIAAADNGLVVEKNQVVKGEKDIPTIWIDPDGCEHWGMDDGWEGFMDIRLTRDGRPVCHRSEICGVMNTDQLFATDKYSISAAGRATLQQFFRTALPYGFLVIRHTDRRASD